MLQKEIVWIIAGLALVAGPAGAATPGTPPAGASCAPADLSAPGPGAARTRVLTGPEAEKRLAERRTASPAMHRALEDSEKRFSSLKMKRLGVAVLIVGEPREPRRTSVPGRIWNWFAPALKAQAVYEPGGEVYISGWDDGDHATWEGNVYAIDYETQGHYAADMQVYVADSGSAPILWDYGWISSPPVRDDFQWAGRRSAPAPRLQRVAMNNNASCNCSSSYGWGRCALTQSINDSWPMCVAAGAWCLASPNYFLCAGGVCYVNVFGRYLANIRDTFHNCYNLQ
jgi:hypothetical protein